MTSVTKAGPRSDSTRNRQRPSTENSKLNNGGCLLFVHAERVITRKYGRCAGKFVNLG